ncbi:MAG: hypothetical protein DMF90_07400 [Acidobacteria bacterium]|nr:MAG: hypothetical protein DMF90_07400 [Acidobacteriota bacterium]
MYRLAAPLPGGTGIGIMKSSRALFVWLLVSTVATGCAIEKSENPLSPTIAGPIPGVNISPPKLLEPVPNQAISTDKQPISLLIENASSNGPRPLNYRFEVASDPGFSNIAFSRAGVPQGTGGRTTLGLPDALASGRNYFWRARAEDGADTGPYATAATFIVFTPVVIGQPVPMSPVGNITIGDLTPSFKVNNAPRSGPAGAITYVLELADSDSFGNKVAIWTFPEQPNQSSLGAPAALPPGKRLFWHVRGYDNNASGPWSDTAVFQTPVPHFPPPGGGGGGGGGCSGHVPPGGLTVERAQQVVLGTACEFPQLTAVFPTDSQALAAADELLRRSIWHLHLAGYQAGRQRNPSGAISSDKLTIFIGGWHAYDIFSLGYAGVATRVQFFEVTPANPVPDGGIPD